MTEDELPSRPEQGNRSTSILVVRAMLLSLLCVFLVGMIAGFVGEHERQGGGAFSSLALGSFFAMGVAALALVIQVIRDIFALFSGVNRMPSRERASMRLLTISLGAGAAAGIIGSTLSHETNWFTGPPGEMPSAVAICLVAFALVVTPWFTFRWWRAVDEHEQAAYVEGAHWAGHFALLSGFTWWILSRAALVPPPDAMVILLAMCVVWTGVGFYRKYS
jgi:hypothetical protein